MNWRPWTQIVSFWPFGGVGSVVDADSTSPSGPELGGLMIPPSFTNVTTVITTRINAAAIVHPTSSRVFPWIWTASAPFLARNL